MPKFSLRILVCTIVLLLVFWVPQTLAIEKAEAIEPYLINGQFAQGAAAMQAQLQKNPGDDQARFILGVTQLMGSVERLMQSLHRYGLRQNSLTAAIPFLRLPTPENPNPQVIRYEDTRQILQTFLDDLATVRATLEPIQDPTVKLPLRLGLVRMDLNADGKVTNDESFWKIFATINRLNISEKQAQAFTIAFDAGDVLWLKGYCNLLAAIVEFGLAHDGRDFFNGLAHIAFAKPETPYPFLTNNRVDASGFPGGVSFVDVIAFVHLLRFPVVEPERMTKALQYLQTTTALSRQSWKLIAAETDNDREWLPNPKQKSVIPNVTVTQDIIDGWMAFLDESDELLTGKKLLPFWRVGEPRGVNLNKVFTAPKTTDVVLWVQGTGAAPYLEFGKVTDARFWQELLQTFRGQFFGFAFWFN